MHRGGNGITCFIRPQILSNFNRRSFLSICSSRAFNVALMSDQRASGFCVFSPVDSLCISTISSFKTHSRGRPGFLVCFIVARGLQEWYSVRDREREYKNGMVSDARLWHVVFSRIVTLDRSDRLSGCTQKTVSVCIKWLYFCLSLISFGRTI